MRRRKDFDAWAYNICWPQSKQALPLLGTVNLTVQDFKFAYNAWSLLRLAMFYGLQHPKVLSDLSRTTPSMGLEFGGNRLFHLNCRVGEPLQKRSVKVALTPDHPRAVPLQAFPWQETIRSLRSDPESEGMEIVLGMENGLSAEVASQCDHHVYIAQYGSIGSLSMMSAMAIATHLAVSAANAHPCSCTALEPRLHQVAPLGEAAVPARGHMPMSNHGIQVVNPRPHETNLLGFSNQEIVELLRSRRAGYPLQLSIMMHNEFGDRNIGAVMRNANAFNCEEMVIVNRRRFNRRGAVGTHHLLKTTFASSLTDPQYANVLEGYEVWLVYQYYPYLSVYPSATDTTPSQHVGVVDTSTFIRHNERQLVDYVATGHVLGKHHPITVFNALLTGATSVSLDDEPSLLAAVREVKQRGMKGIMLAVPEEGTVPHPELLAASHRVLYVVSPASLNNEVQRGLNAALSTAVALERIRTCIDSL